MNTMQFRPIGFIQSPHPEKFSVPRQPNLVKSSCAELHLFPPYNDPNTLRGLTEFSHIWLIFVFHQLKTTNWHATVRPPRLGGKQRLGVFATRSMFRPNPIGLSATELRGIEVHSTHTILKLGSVDLVHGTPILDIKPYLPFADAIPSAIGGFAKNAPEKKLQVKFSTESLHTLNDITENYPTLSLLITEVLAQDPRPAYRSTKSDPKKYAMRLYTFNIHWHMQDEMTAYVTHIE